MDDLRSFVRKYLAYISGAIGLATTVMIFIGLVQNNYYLGATVSITLLLTIVVIGSTYFGFAKTAPLISGGKGVYRYPNLRHWAIAIDIIIFGLVLFLLVYKPSRGFLVVAIQGTPTTVPNPIRIEQVLVGVSREKLQLETTVFNPEKNALVRTVLLKVLTGKDCAKTWETGGGPTISFEISDTLLVENIITGTQRLEGSMIVQDQPKYQYPVRGYLADDYEDCQLLYLNFDTSFELPPNQYTSFNILVPRNMKIKSIEGTRAGDTDFYNLKNYPADINNINDVWRINDYFATDIQLTTDQNGDVLFWHFSDCEFGKRVGLPSNCSE